MFLLMFRRLYQVVSPFPGVGLDSQVLQWRYARGLINPIPRLEVVLIGIAAASPCTSLWRDCWARCHKQSPILDRSPFHIQSRR